MAHTTVLMPSVARARLRGPPPTCTGATGSPSPNSLTGRLAAAAASIRPSTLRRRASAAAMLLGEVVSGVGCAAGDPGQPASEPHPRVLQHRQVQLPTVAASTSCSEGSWRARRGSRTCSMVVSKVPSCCSHHQMSLPR